MRRRVLLIGAALGLAASASLDAQQDGECTAGGAAANLDFTLEDMRGNDVTLSDYAGDVILLDFWATWCAPCRIEIPGFIEMHDDYKDRGFSVLGISVDDPVEDLRPYAAELAMDYPVLVGRGRDDVKEAFGPLLGFPTTLIIDRDGTVCHRHVGLTAEARFRSEIEALL